MTTVKEPRPQLDPEAAPWVSASKKLYAALQNEDIVSWIWEFSYMYPTNLSGLEDVRQTEGGNHAPQSWRERSTPPLENWEQIIKRIESPHPSPYVDQTSWTGIKRGPPNQTFASDHLRCAQNGSCANPDPKQPKPPPNFSRPFQRPSQPDSDGAGWDPDSGGSRPKVNARKGLKSLLLSMKAKLKPRKNRGDLQSHRDAKNDVVSHECDRGEDLRPLDSIPREILQPQAPPPVETLRPPDPIPRRKLRPPDILPKDTLRPPDHHVPRKILRPADQLPVETLRPPDSVSNGTLSSPNPPCLDPIKMISKLKRKIVHCHGNPTSSENEKQSDEHSCGSFFPHHDTTHLKVSSLSRAKNYLDSLSQKWKHCKPEEDSQWPLKPSKPLPQTQSNSNVQSPTPPSRRRNRLRKSQFVERASFESNTLSADSKVSAHSSFRKNCNEHHLSLNVPAIPLVEPQPFRCTFCLAQCVNKQDWMEHERVVHFKDPEWHNNFDDHDKDRNNQSTPSCPSAVSRARSSLRGSHIHSRSIQSHTSSSRMDIERGKGWVWNCGFCQTFLRSWDERQEHISEEHFEKGETMSSWDPLRLPYPWKRGSGTPSTGLPCWDLTSLLAIQQQPTLVDSINQVGETRKRTSCKLCQIPPRSRKVSTKHMQLWHNQRDIWSCPTLTDTTNLTFFFDTNDNDPDDNTITDFCLCCGAEIVRPDYLDRSARMLHLRQQHSFHDRACWDKWFNEEQFCLHLANCHAVSVENVKEFMDCCKTDSRAPALIKEDPVDLPSRD